MSRTRVEELSARHRAACDFTQPIDEARIKAALRQWIRNCGGPDVEVKIASNWNEAAWAARAAWAAGAAWAARAAGAAGAARAAYYLRAADKLIELLESAPLDGYFMRAV